MQVQRSTPCIWVKVIPENTEELRKFKVIPEGLGFDDYNNELSFIGTFQLGNGGLVFHLFEVIS